MEFNKTKKENNNEKAFRLTLWVLSILSVIFALVNIPKQGNISEIRQETRNTAKQIKVARQQAQNNSPLFAANNFNLTDQEKTATDRLSQGLQTTFGGLKTENDFKTQKSKIQSLMGKSLPTFLSFTILKLLILITMKYMFTSITLKTFIMQKFLLTHNMKLKKELVLNHYPLHLILTMILQLKKLIAIS